MLVFINFDEFEMRHETDCRVGIEIIFFGYSVCKTVHVINYIVVQSYDKNTS